MIFYKYTGIKLHSYDKKCKCWGFLLKNHLSFTNYHIFHKQFNVKTPPDCTTVCSCYSAACAENTNKTISKLLQAYFLYYVLWENIIIKLSYKMEHVGKGKYGVSNTSVIAQH